MRCGVRAGMIAPALMSRIITPKPPMNSDGARGRRPPELAIPACASGTRIQLAENDEQAQRVGRTDADPATDARREHRAKHGANGSSAKDQAEQARIEAEIVVA